MGALLTAWLGGGCASYDPSRAQPLVQTPEHLSRSRMASDLAEAEAALRLLEKPGTTAAQHEDATQRYQKATHRIFTRGWKNPAITAGLRPGTGKRGETYGAYRVMATDAADGEPAWSLDYFDRTIPATEVQAGAEGKRIRRDGIGVPYVATRLPTTSRTNEAQLWHRSGLHLPMTVVLDFPESNSGTNRMAHLRLIDPRRAPTLPFGTNALPVAADFSAPMKRSLGNGEFERLAWLGLFNPGLHLKEANIYLLEPYDPYRIPVLFVHGLESGPHIWRKAIASLMADPELSARYQFWYYVYPTGLPVPGSAARLRLALRTARQLYDPANQHPAFEQMVLVGHSMGGLLSRMQVIDSGDELWGALFSKAPGALKLSEKSLQTLTESLYFTRQPFVSCAIFVATPHRGSHIADWNLVRWLVRFIQIPTHSLHLAQEMMTLNVNALQPGMMNYKMLGATSLDTLSAKHPYFKALEKRPIQAEFHSVIGDRGRGDSPKSSDGFVPYWSSHLDGAMSERIVPAGHSCTDCTEVIDEIRHVLRSRLKATPSALMGTAHRP
jgi:pimeloyl-ACP methyl ester carboxylesterase